MHPSVDAENLAGDVAVAQDCQGEVSDLLRTADPADGRGLGQLLWIAGKHRGLDEARREDVDGDAVNGDPAGQEMREAVEPGLGGGVVRTDDAAPEGRYRGDEQHATEASLAHPRQDSAGEQEGRSEIDRQRAVEGRGIDVLVAGLVREAVICDEDVNGSERRLDVVD